MQSQHVERRRGPHVGPNAHAIKRRGVEGRWAAASARLETAPVDVEAAQARLRACSRHRLVDRLDTVHELDQLEDVVQLQLAAAFVVVGQQIEAPVVVDAPRANMPN